MSVSPDILDKLRGHLAGFRKSPMWREIIDPQDEVVARFRPMFSQAHLGEITADEVKSFLLDKNNKHWSGLYRGFGRMCADMQQLRSALSILLDESRDLATRFTKATDMVKGMGRNIASAILLVRYPDRYGVWNTPVEAVMKQHNIWPEFRRGMTLGEKYAELNDLLIELCRELDIDPWTIDGLWWYMRPRRA